MSKPRDDEFFRDGGGELKYNSKCARCARGCKQSFKVKIMNCPKFKQKKKNEPASGQTV